MLGTEMPNSPLLRLINYSLQRSIKIASEGGPIRREMVRNLLIYPIAAVTEGHSESRRHAAWQTIHDNAQQAIEDLRGK